MKLYHLGHVPWLDSQLIYHAFPRLDMEGLILLAPAEPYVCIGYFQDVDQDIDLDYCRAHDIPVFRREVGGGGVYLDGKQLFYQIVIHKDNPLAPKDKAEFYRVLLTPVAQTYIDLGIPARYKPVNDVVTETGKKISGTGAAEIGDYLVLVGNLIYDFDYDTMVRVLRVPDEKFRGKVHATLQENLTTLRRELATPPTWEAMTAVLIRNFETAFGPLTPASLPDAVGEKVADLARTHTTEEWLRRPGRRLADRRDVKIATGVNVIQRVHKAPGGLIRAILQVQAGQIVSAELSGDFFFFPSTALPTLEVELMGKPLAEVEAVVERFYVEHGIESPGVTPRDLALALSGA
jgi:lipoate-protein ligase A